MPPFFDSLLRRFSSYANSSNGADYRTRPRHLERLEDRRLLTVLRLATYNAANGPNNPTQEALFSTIFDSIGNETVAGNTERLAVLALQETDSLQGGGNSVLRIENVLDTLYGTNAYQHVITPLDGGGDATGFVYDTTQVSLLSNAVVPGDFTHDVMRAEFRPLQTDGDADFFMYTAHLKAGTSGSDSSKRGAEAQLLRNDADALGSSKHIVMMGDWNMQNSFEPAYVNLTALGSGRVDDPINRPGFWHDSASFKDIHTQNPRSGGGGGMDDRFDIMFVGEAFDSVGGLDYVTGSYHAFGNSNTHSLNQGIETGTALNATVRGALAVASDHIPVVMDIEFSATPSAFTIVESGGSTVVDESGMGDSYTFVLNAVPQSDITLTVTPDNQIDLGLGAAVPIELTFTPSNALIAQQVFVAAFDDSDPEGPHTGTITHSLSSLDANFDGLSVPEIVVAINDDEAVPETAIVISEIMYNPDTSEGGSALPEWVEIVNIGEVSEDLGGWRLRDEDDQWEPIPAGTIVQPLQTVVLYDSGFVNETTFRSAWNIPAAATLVGVSWGGLANSPSATNEILELVDETNSVFDTVNFDDSAGWPSDSPDGPSIYLSDIFADNSVGTSWSRSLLGFDGAAAGSTPFSTADIGSPGSVPLPVSAEPPLVESVVLNGGDSQRSTVTSVVVTFDSLVDVDDAAFSIANLGLPSGTSGAIVDGLLVSSVDVGTQTVSTITFGVGSQIISRGSANTLLDGNFRLDTNALMVFARGTTTAMLSDFQFGQNATDNFFRLYGDADGDGDTDFNDFSSAFLPAFGSNPGSASYAAELDADGDEDVDFNDFSSGFLPNFGTMR